MGKNTLIVLGFLLLCILLSLDKKEGFVTINSNFFCSGNSDTNTCNISLSGSTGYICRENEDNIYYTETTTDNGPRNLASGSFNIIATGCSEAGYADGEPMAASACSHSGEDYSLSGCSPKCARPANIPDHYNLNGFNLPLYISPLEGDGRDGVIDTSMTCNNNVGYFDAVNICFDRENGQPTPSLSEENCGTASAIPNIWYDSSGNNGVKLVCNSDSSEYKIIGCEQGCLSRIRDMQEYYTLDETDRDKELVQILDRSDDGSTTLKKPSSTLYNVTENNITPSSEFSVDVTGGETTFKSDPNDNSETGVSINFSGEAGTQRCDSIVYPDYNKYNIMGLFPVCDNTHECLNFSVEYDNFHGGGIPENIYNINDFKQHLSENISGIIDRDSTPEQIEDYINSLYYYRRYKDRNGHIHIEGQLRCDTDESSPFYCEIGENLDPATNPLYIQNGGYCYNPIFDPEQAAHDHLSSYREDTPAMGRYIDNNPGASPLDWWDSIRNSPDNCNENHGICRDGSSYSTDSQRSCYHTYYPSEWREV